jgi:alcohol dehydrogenase class IV
LNSEIIPDFHLPTKIYIQQDLTTQLAPLIDNYGQRALIICTSSDFEYYHEVLGKISSLLKESGIGCIVHDELPPHPNTEDIDAAVTFAKKTNCDIIIGFGGTESINAAKAIALLANNFLFADSLFNKPGNLNPTITLITMPTVPIYGFEISPILFLTEIHGKTKQIYYNKMLYPAATIVDPSLSFLTDETFTLQNSVCTLAIATESVISKANNDIINTFALKSIDLIFRNTPLVFNDSQNATPRMYLATASIMSGIALSTAYLSVTLAISLAISVRSDIDLETAIGIILPHIMEFNLTSSPGKYVQMSKVMGEDVRDITVIEAAIKAVEAIRKLTSDLNIPQRLSSFNISKADFPEIANIAISYPFLEFAPRPVNTSEIETILIAAY